MSPQISPRLTCLAVIAGVAVAGLTAATAGAPPSIEDLQYEGRVVVGPDGNGWVAARFPTTVGGDDVTYYLDVWTGCGEAPAFERDEYCPPPAKALGVTLNGEVVFRKAPVPTAGREEIALHLVGTTDNEIMVSADGDLGSAASFAVVAVRLEGKN